MERAQRQGRKLILEMVPEIPQPSLRLFQGPEELEITDLSHQF